jgi:ADP-ribose pyrophosphatase
MTWKTITSEIIHKTKWIELVKDRVIMPNGQEGEYTFVKKNDGAGVIIVDEEYTYLVSQYRYPIKRTVLQFPLEGLENGEDPKIAAIRCLKEELGMEGDIVEYCGKAYVDPGLKVESVYFYIIKNVKKVENHLEGSEADLKIKKTKVSELEEYIENGEIIDYSTFTGFYFLQKYLRKNKI